MINDLEIQYIQSRINGDDYEDFPEVRFKGKERLTSALYMMYYETTVVHYDDRGYEFTIYKDGWEKKH